LDKKRIDTSGFAKIHNLFLCLLSLLMSIGCFVSNLSPDVQGNFCVSRDQTLPDHLRFWYHIYYLSKFYEYIDTLLLIINRKPLTLLHIYHHCLVTFISWSWVRGNLPYCTIGVYINSFIHVIMYYYFFETARGRRDIWWKKHITHMQIAQFGLGVTLPFIVAYVHYTTEGGCRSYPVFVAGTFFNATLLYLFVDFFRKAYLGGQSRRAARDTKSENETVVVKEEDEKKKSGALRRTIGTSPSATVVKSNKNRTQ